MKLRIRDREFEVEEITVKVSGKGGVRIYLISDWPDKRYPFRASRSLDDLRRGGGTGADNRDDVIDVVAGR